MGLENKYITEFIEKVWVRVALEKDEKQREIINGIKERLMKYSRIKNLNAIFKRIQNKEAITEVAAKLWKKDQASKSSVTMKPKPFGMPGSK